VSFEWDPNKAANNLAKHGIGFVEAVSVFLDPLARTYGDPDHSTSESREIPIGHSVRGRVLIVAHTERSGRLRIISARRATPRERTTYEQSKTQG